MSTEAQSTEEATVERRFEQPPDAPSFFADFAQIVGTGNAVIVQFYEPVPGPPVPPKGNVAEVRTRLRATIHLTPSMAAKVGNLLLQKSSG